MQAIEFETDVLDDVIHIPRRFKKNTKNHHFKVIMMPQDEEIGKKKESIRDIFSDSFQAQKINFFNREELHAR